MDHFKCQATYLKPCKFSVGNGCPGWKFESDSLCAFSNAKPMNQSLVILASGMVARAGNSNLIPCAHFRMPWDNPEAGTTILLLVASVQIYARRLRMLCRNLGSRPCYLLGPCRVMLNLGKLSMATNGCVIMCVVFNNSVRDTDTKVCTYP